MKGPIILALISVLIAAPLFAETITLKNGQTYTGEILEETSEYIKLKTESEVLRIEMSTIAKITTSDVEAGRALTPEAVAEAAAEAEVDKALWFSAGCFLNVIGIAIAYSVKPSPPQSHLIGKSPEYVWAFAEAYEQKAESIQRNMAMTGCVVGSILASAAAFLAITAMQQSMEEQMWGGGPSGP